MRLELMRWMVRGAGLALGGAAVLGLVLLAFSAAGVLLLIFLSILSRRASGRS